MLEKRWKQFCKESTFHGFLEIFHAPSLLFKISWMLIVIAGTITTCYQIYLQIDNYKSNPIKTVISFKPSVDTDIPYPPHIIKSNHFYDWLNLQKAKAIGFDVETLVYFLTYLEQLNWTFVSQTYTFNGTDEKLRRIMNQQNITNLYDLTIALSLPIPPFLEDRNYYTFSRFLKEDDFDGRVSYVKKDPICVFRDMSKFQYVYFQDVRNFNENIFYRDAMTLYNYSFSQELFMHINEYNTMFTFNVGGLGDDVTVTPYLAQFNIHIKATLFSWSADADKTCRISTEPTFYVDCLKNCTEKHKLLYRPPICAWTEPMMDKIGKTITKQMCDYAHEIWVTATNNGSVYPIKSCVEECMATCDKWKYDYKQLTFVLDHSRQNNMVQFTYELENILVISLQPAATWDDMVANLGGLLGLWLGGSILSFLQLIYIFCCLPLASISGADIKSKIKKLKWVRKRDIVQINTPQPVKLELRSQHKFCNSKHKVAPQNVNGTTGAPNLVATIP